MNPLVGKGGGEGYAEIRGHVTCGNLQCVGDRLTGRDRERLQTSIDAETVPLFHYFAVCAWYRLDPTFISVSEMNWAAGRLSLMTG